MLTTKRLLPSLARCAALGGLLALLLVAGCGPANGRQSVSGTVTFQGTPLPSGTIEFRPLDAGATTMEGALVRDGQYLLPAGNGLVPGKYQVRITHSDQRQMEVPEDSPGDPRGKPVPKELIPKQYNVNSILTAEVTARGPNRFDFDLK